VGCLASIVPSTKALADSIDVRLALDGRDVTGAFDVEIGFFDVDLSKDAPPVFRCKAGERVVVPRGTFRLDVRSDEVVSWTRPIVTSDGNPTRVVHEFRIQVVRAALLRTPAGSYPAGSRLDVLSVAHGVLYQRRIEREARIVPVPAEDAIYGVIDPAKRLIGLLRLNPPAGEIFDLPSLPRLSRGAGQLHVGLRYPPGFDEPGRRLAPVLVREQGRSPADVVIDCGSSLAAFWLSVPAGEGRLTLESAKWTTVSPVALRVPDRGAVSLASVQLAARPPLEVDLEVPDHLRAATVTLELLDCQAIAAATGPPDLSRCRTMSSRRGGSGETFRFDGLALGTHALRWRLKGLSDVIRIDVAEAVPVKRTVRVRPFVVGGVVTRAKRPLAGATLRFASPWLSSEVVARTDDEGRYEVELARQGSYEVEVDSAAGIHETIVSVKADGDADIEVPPATLHLRVTDQSSGRPIPGATVVASLALPEGMSNWTAVTSSEGSATLPPLPAGIFRLLASAEGFDSVEAKESTLESGNEARTVEIRLPPARGRRLRLFEYSGEPAAGSVVALPGAGDAQAGVEGLVTIPDGIPPGTGLYAWNREGRLVFFRLSDSGEQDVRFGPPGAPIRLRSVRPTGVPVQDWAPTILVDGISFSGPSGQAQLAGSDLWPRRDGGLRLAGFPAIGIIVVAPMGHPELVVTRTLPFDDEIVFTLPLASGP
jgi:hypothetical protein